MDESNSNATNGKLVIAEGGFWKTGVNGNANSSDYSVEFASLNLAYAILTFRGRIQGDTSLQLFCGSDGDCVWSEVTRSAADEIAGTRFHITPFGGDSDILRIEFDGNHARCRFKGTRVTEFSTSVLAGGFSIEIEAPYGDASVEAIKVGSP